ncbi:MAG: hypothetical protein PARBA_01336 [Parabacteroides sp.]
MVSQIITMNSENHNYESSKTYFGIKIKNEKKDFSVRVFFDWRVIIMKRTIISLKVYKKNG